MDLVRRSESWKAAHRDSIIILAFRVVLGLVLVFKGISFIQNSSGIHSVLAQSLFEFGDIAIAHYIIMIHVAGGLMIAAGFLTRVAVLFQLPILIGAVFFVNASRGMFPIYSEFLIALLVLLALVFFLFYGSGIYSLQKMLKSNKYYQ